MSNISLLSDTLLIKHLAMSGSNDLIKTADEGEGVVSTVVSNIKNSMPTLVKGQEVESVLAFIGPGLLWKLGFPWMGAIFAVMEALGFNWTGFFNKIHEGIKPLLTSNTEINYASTKSIVDRSANDSFTGDVDENKLKDAAKKYSHNQKINDADSMIKVANLFKKTARSSIPGIDALKNLLIPKSRGFISSIVAWVIMVVLISAGFRVAGAAVKGILGIKDKKQDNTQELGSGQRSSSIIPLKLNPNADPELFVVHPNDMYNIWVEDFNINEIENHLIQWAISAYPELKNNINAMRQSSTFRNLVNILEDRNQKAIKLNIVSIPRPFTRKIDLVNTFAGEVAKSLGI